ATRSSIWANNSIGGSLKVEFCETLPKYFSPVKKSEFGLVMSFADSRTRSGSCDSELRSLAVMRR
ncbi:MAG: hypothetical protein WA354_09360, partial [Terracidiphilus sp.]